jgi:hypothetical protein
VGAIQAAWSKDEEMIRSEKVDCGGGLIRQGGLERHAQLSDLRVESSTKSKKEVGKDFS